MQAEIRIAAALVLRENGETLLVRKRGTGAFIQPGGKIEPGETPKAALARELREEIGLDIAPSRMAPFGRFEAAAANEPDHIVIAHVFQVELRREAVTPAAEIEEAVWVPVHAAGALPLAPLTRDNILPLFCQMQFSTELHYGQSRSAETPTLSLSE